LNGTLRAKSMSLDQACFVRVTTDKWKTFQETEAIDIGDESSVMQTRYKFDFMIPVPRENVDENLQGPIESNEDTDENGIPNSIEFFVVLRSLGLLYIDDNDKEKYVLGRIQKRNNIEAALRRSSIPVFNSNSGPTTVSSSTAAPSPLSQ